MRYPKGISALFVETAGCYFGLPGVDPWDILRDARLYTGSAPVVAHPPCQRWGRFAKGSMTKQDWTPGDDDGCFASALASLVRCGGVLEHPAHSLAWKAFDIPKPPPVGWLEYAPGRWTCEVEQGHYGHPARKKTWLLAFGSRPLELIWGPAPQRLPAKRLAERGYESARRCGVVANMSTRQRQRTPHEFRDLLIRIARGCALKSSTKGKAK